MKSWIRRARAAVVMGLMWAIVWAPVGILVGLLVDPDGSLDEMWFAVFGYPGFLGGVLFSVVLSLIERRRRVEELSVTRVATWGALAGAVVGSLPFLLGTPTNRVPVFVLAATVIGSTTLLSALSAAGTLAIARKASARTLPAANAEEDAFWLAQGEAQASLVGEQHRSTP